MQFSLPALVRQKGNPRRSEIDLRPIQPTNALASDLYSVYRPIVDKLSAALPHIVAAYSKAQPLADGLARDAASDDLRSLFASLADDLQRLVTTLVPGITTWADRVERWHRGRWRGNVLSATNVDLETILMASGKPKSVADSIAWNVALIKDVSTQAQTRITQAVYAAAQARTPATGLASELRDIVGMSRRRSLGIASDQLQKLSAALDRERATEAGLRRYNWRHSAKAHPRPVHVARNGKVFRYDEPPADGPPGSLPWCGCRAQAKIELD
jgi:SPP1 gp7 family putative phage head morphogenesis protein